MKLGGGVDAPQLRLQQTLLHLTPFQERVAAAAPGVFGLRQRVLQLGNELRVQRRDDVTRVLHLLVIGEQQRARHESAEARLQEAADLRVGEANRVVAQASRSAGASQSAKVLETLVSRLKTQLSSKEKRIAQLKDAVRELEKKLGDALTRSADVAARAAGTVSERAASRSGEENRAAVLAEKLRRARATSASSSDFAARCRACCRMPRSSLTWTSTESGLQ